MNRPVKYKVNVKLGYYKYVFEFDDLRDADNFAYCFLNNLKVDESDPDKLEVSIVPVLVPEQPEEVEADE